jgi:hypothetical protein
MCGKDGVVPTDDGGWKCKTCVASEKIRTKYDDVKLTIIPCPACIMSGLTATCLVCNKLGSVKVPDSEIRILSTAAMPQVLTESTPEPAEMLAEG